MSLYDGEDIDNKTVPGKDVKPDLAGWSSGFRMLHSQLRAKKASLLQAKQQRKSGTSLPPVVDLKSRGGAADGELRFNQSTGKIEKVPYSISGLGGGGAAPPIPTPFLATEAPLVAFTGITDEYNPLVPNDYEEFQKKQRERRQKEREDERKRDLEDREKKRKERHRERDMHPDDDQGEFPQAEFPQGEFPQGEFAKRARMRQDSDEEEEFDPKPNPNRGSGAAIAPPASLIEEDKKDDDNDSDGDYDLSALTKGGANAVAHPMMPLVNSKAGKMMSKMGYKIGKGLGKREHGMSMALQVEKISKRGGRIIHEKDIPKFTEPEPLPPKPANTALLANPSKVVLLLNMVGPGEVDEDLEPETAEECTKYGKVIKCLIFEIPNHPDEEAVRIFVEFEKMEAAIKAVIDLNGRFFGGRTVKAMFYNLDKFRRLDLVDKT